MEPTVATFAEEVARLIRASDDHPAMALCQLAKSRTLFRGLTTDLRERLAAIPSMEEPVAPPAELEPLPSSPGRRVTRRVFRRFCGSVVLAALAMFACGYYAGQSPASRTLLRLPELIERVTDTWQRVWPASQSPAPPSNPEDGA